jgi:hypothetical protein
MTTHPFWVVCYRNNRIVMSCGLPVLLRDSRALQRTPYSYTLASDVESVSSLGFVSLGLQPLRSVGLFSAHTIIACPPGA